MRVEAVMVVWFCLRRFGRLDAIVGDSHLFCYTLCNYYAQICAIYIFFVIKITRRNVSSLAFAQLRWPKFRLRSKIGTQFRRKFTSFGTVCCVILLVFVTRGSTILASLCNFPAQELRTCVTNFLESTTMNHLPSLVSKAKRHHRDDGSIANEQQQQEEAAACQRAAGGQPLSKG